MSCGSSILVRLEARMRGIMPATPVESETARSRSRAALHLAFDADAVVLRPRDGTVKTAHTGHS